MDFFRETQLGQIARWLTNNRILLYSEEKPGFHIPVPYLGSCTTAATFKEPKQELPEDQKISEASGSEEEISTEKIVERPGSIESTESELLSLRNSAALSRITTRPDMQRILTWYATDDPENPQNWNFWAKSNIVFQMYQYVVVVYMGSAIYSASSSQFMEVFGVTQSVASLGLGLYVFMWELLWASTPSFILFLLFLPETSTPTILYRRAQRLRKLTGNPSLKAESEIAQSNLSPSQMTFIHFYVNPRMRVKGFKGPEQRLIPAVVASFIIPVGLFLFGWTSRPSIHWIVPAIGAALIAGGIVTIINNILFYAALAYPKYSASLFAGNDIVRSTIAFAGIMWSGPLFGNFGVGRGCTLLAGLTVGCIVGIEVLYVYGAKLRVRSKFAI
ncbi:hypothetical protein BDV96DRAFT_600309 [Lophiotrema nucula]|uniref:Major facilitator superfamily domain-containing protein n=1 Tax=Lophiotrema nucula TaxID=690887 RepID=A0A6A5Z5D2_9PLEO|nr:hypothetical protein BDV96DRAFT_600309 [Lophiotrema nucula]